MEGSGMQTYNFGTPLIVSLFNYRHFMILLSFLACKSVHRMKIFKIYQLII